MDTTTARSTYRPRLLIVDDVPANVAILGEALLDDYEVQFATSGAEALQLAQQSRPDLVLLDIMMPDMDGYETCRRLHAMPELRNIPVVFVTALTEAAAEAAGLALGAVDYITKPFDLHTTRLRIRNLLERERLRGELELALAGASQGLWEWDNASDQVAFSAQAAQPLGFSTSDGEPYLVTWDQIVDPADLPALRAAIDEHLNGATAAISLELRLRDIRGEFRWIHLQGRRFGSPAETRRQRIAGVYTDIQARKQTELALAEREAQLSLLIASIPDMVLSYDSDGRLHSMHAPAALRDLLEFERWQDRSCSEILIAPLAESLHNATLLAMDHPQPQVAECCFAEAGSTTRYLHVTVNRLAAAGQAKGFLAVVRDISIERRADEEIRRLAHHDALTGLANRRLLLERLRLAQLNSARMGTYAALVFIDLDNFKALNDRWSHHVGDLLLVELAGKLKGCVRENDLVARLGGDEFVVLLEQLGGDEISAQMRMQKITDNLLAVLNRHYSLGEIDYVCSGSIGVRLFCGKDEDSDRILDDADTSMYQAKQAKRANFNPFADAATQRRNPG